MIRRFSLVLLALAALSLPLAPTPALAKPPVAHTATKECTVYVTRTGHKYHKAWCSSLRYSRRAMTRAAAIAAGYTACRRCGGSDCE